MHHTARSTIAAIDRRPRSLAGSALQRWRVGVRQRRVLTPWPELDPAAVPEAAPLALKGVSHE